MQSLAWKGILNTMPAQAIINSKWYHETKIFLTKKSSVM